ncbi:MAG TPA: nitrate ABC transporter substrate-binding protein, partial [Marinobacter adhaerens]|nr:nitrate ABC transporter substrate-binding protein [Marinobacter adhaerens]
MTTKSLGNPFDGDKSLIHAKTCGCPECKPGDSTPSISLDLKPSAGQQAVADEHLDSEAMMDRAIEGAVVRSVFGHNEHSRRAFMKMMGAGTAAAVLGSVFPMEKAKAAVKESLGKL